MGYRKDVLQTKVHKLVADAESGRLCLPDFQREFVWTPSQMALLLESVVRQYPIGTFLFLKAEGNTGLGTRSFLGAGESVRNPKFYVIDGQQRIMTFLRLLRAPDGMYLGRPIATGTGSVKVFFRATQDLAHLPSEVTKPSFIVPKSVADDEVEEYDWQGRQRLIPVELLAKPDLVRRWCDKALAHLSGRRRKSIRCRLLGVSRRLRDYECPAEVIEGRLKLKDHANMFSLLNEAGTNLTLFDQVGAQLGPEGIGLRLLWREARRDYPEIDKYDIDPEYILRVQVLIAQVRSDYQYAPTCRRRDVRTILDFYDEHKDKPGTRARAFRKDWTDACRYVVKALTLLAEEFGVRKWKYVPYSPMLITLAAIRWWVEDYKGYPQRYFGAINRKLRQWYWGSVFDQAYQAHTDTVISNHFVALREWLAPGQRKRRPASIAFRFGRGDIHSAIRKLHTAGDARYRAMLCIPLMHNARDIYAEESLATAELQDHHIFPRAFLPKSIPNEERNNVANRMLITDRTNQAIKDKPPSVYLAGRSQKILRQHYLFPELLDQRMRYASFLRRRSDLLTRRIVELLQGK